MTEFVEKPGTHEAPLALYARRGHLELLCNLLDGKAAEVAKQDLLLKTVVGQLSMTRGNPVIGGKKLKREIGFHIQILHDHNQNIHYVVFLYPYQNPSRSPK